VVVVGGLVLIALGVLWLGTRAAVTASSGDAGPLRDRGLPWVTVHQGDTLWGIASAVSAGEDPASVVRQIMNLNGLSGSLIQPGGRLYLPGDLTP
jgi:hypothetical protein